jgi:hypothetical protein
VGRSLIIRRRESLVLYKSFNTLQVKRTTRVGFNLASASLLLALEFPSISGSIKEGKIDITVRQLSSSCSLIVYLMYRRMASFTINLF